MPTETHRGKRHGLDPEDYNLMLRAYDGCCYICKRPERVANRSLAIDHCHTTGTVRGLLCTRCNQVIGRMEDSPALLRAAADYLELAWRQYPDGCTTCRETGVEFNAEAFAIYYPESILETNGESWTRFLYRCAKGHTWGCGYRTTGTPKWLYS
jgi:hypothetical protein